MAAPKNAPERSAATPGTASFFARTLTPRQLLTKRQVIAGVTVMLAIGLPAAWKTGLLGALSQSSAAAAGDTNLGATGESAATAHVVHVLRCGAAGPDLLTQSYTGLVTARRATALATKTLGRVEHISVDLGDPVVQGQVLISLDARELSAQQQVLTSDLHAAEAKLRELEAGPRAQEIEVAAARVAELMASFRLAEANFGRTQELFHQAVASTQDRDESQYRLDSAKAQLASAREELDLLHEGTRQEQVLEQAARVESLRAHIQQIAIAIGESQIAAPFDGHVAARHIDEGTVVSAGQAILEIVESGEMEVRVGLPAEQCSAAQRPFITLHYEDSPLRAEPVRISPTIDQRTRTRELVFRILESAAEIPIGASIVVGASNSTTAVSPVASIAASGSVLSTEPHAPAATRMPIQIRERMRASLPQPPGPVATNRGRAWPAPRGYSASNMPSR